MKSQQATKSVNKHKWGDVAFNAVFIVGFVIVTLQTNLVFSLLLAVCLYIFGHALLSIIKDTITFWGQLFKPQTDVKDLMNSFLRVLTYGIIIALITCVLRALPQFL